MHDREINGQKAASMLPQNERNKYNVPKKCSFGIKCEKKTREKPAVRDAGHTKNYAVTVFI